MKKSLLCVFVLGFFSLCASDIEPKKIVPKVKTSYNSQVYLGALFEAPSVGMVSRDSSFTREYDYKFSSLAGISILSVCYSKVYKITSYEDGLTSYTGIYGGVGVGGGIMKDYTPTLIPLVIEKAFIGYQGTLGFIDLGLDVLYIVPCLTLRVGFNF